MLLIVRPLPHFQSFFYSRKRPDLSKLSTGIYLAVFRVSLRFGEAGALLGSGGASQNWEGEDPSTGKPMGIDLANSFIQFPQPTADERD